MFLFVDSDCIMTGVPLGVSLHIHVAVSLLMVGVAYCAPNFVPNLSIFADEASTSGADKTFVCVTFSDE